VLSDAALERRRDQIGSRPPASSKDRLQRIRRQHALGPAPQAVGLGGLDAGLHGSDCVCAELQMT